MNKQTPFFILGSVRSGTTLLRNLLRQHPNLTCPEETHIFRWAEPFNSNDYNHVNKTAEVLKMHRKMDNVDEMLFSEILHHSKDRGGFLTHYFDLFQQAQDKCGTRCFDKTPQNVYGLPLIKAFFPDAKIIHIVRNPLNVVTSLRKGRGLNPQNVIGAINFWKEAVLILNTLKPILKDNLFEIKYEELTNNPKKEYTKLLRFLEEDIIDIGDIREQVNSAKDLYLKELSSKEIKLVKSELKQLMQIYNY